jgi:hypothetical protein
MGRTIPSFTMALMEEESQWKPFRQCLDKPDRSAFDDMFSIPRLYISSCMYSANPVVLHPIILSILFHHYKHLGDLVTRIEAMSGDRIDPVST